MKPAAAFLFLLALPLYADFATQTDWSAGTGGWGETWEHSFLDQTSIDFFSIPGSLTIAGSGTDHQVSPSERSSTVPADVDDDGWIDIVCPYDWWRNADGAGLTWEHVTVGPVADAYYSVEAADIDEDGDIDIVAGNYTKGLYWIENIDGLGQSWTDHVLDTGWVDWSSIAAEDFDNDGDIDIWALIWRPGIGYDLMWFENGGSGDSWISGEYRYALDYQPLATIDFDSDGDIDLAGFVGTQIVLLENPGSFSLPWTSPVSIDAYSGITAISSLDLDQDGDCDLIWNSAYSYPPGTYWSENLDGSGQEWDTRFIGGEDGSELPETVVSCGLDIDSDGDLDIITSPYAGMYFHLYVNNLPYPLLVPWDSYHIGQVPSSYPWCSSLGTADIDSDASMDFIYSGLQYRIGWIDLFDPVFPTNYCCFLESEPILLDIYPQQWDSLLCTASVPAGTTLQFHVRSGEETWNMGDWSAPIVPPASLVGVSTNGFRYFQYRVEMYTSDPGITPVLEDVTVVWNYLEGIGEDARQQLSIVSACPNPCPGTLRLSVELGSSGFLNLEVFDISGRIISTTGSGCFSEGTHSVQLDGFAPGVYFVRLAAGDAVASQRFVVIE